MTNLTKLRIASAKALGYEPEELMNAEGDKFISIWQGREERTWQPDKDPAQLVELIEWLLQSFWWHEDKRFYTFSELVASLHHIRRKCELENDDWKLALMRAVAEVSNDNS